MISYIVCPRTISKLSKRERESSSCVYVSHKRDILGNLTWKSCGIVKKCTRKCAPRAVLLSRSLSLFYFFDFLRFMNSNVRDSKSIEENAQNIRFEIFVVKPDSEPNRLSDQTYTKPILGCLRFGFVLGSLSNDDGHGPTAARTEKKVIGLDWQNNNFARVSRFFVHFLPSLQYCDVKLPNFTSVLWRTGTHDNHFLFLFVNLDTVVYNSTPEKNRQHLTN